MDRLEKLLYSVKYLPQILYFGSIGLILLDIFLDIELIGDKLMIALLILFFYMTYLASKNYKSAIVILAWITPMTYIYGVGRSRAKTILATAGVDESKKVNEWNDDEIGRIRDAVGSFTIEGELRSETQLNIKRLMDIGSFRGIRHRVGLPLRGQRTKNNSRTRKGKRKTVANKKKVTK